MVNYKWISFNSDIVECKFVLSKDGAVFGRVLIVTQWNVNRRNKNAKGHGAPVLIVTQWNVNSCGELQPLEWSNVLIVTQWNVN